MHDANDPQTIRVWNLVATNPEIQVIKLAETESIAYSGNNATKPLISDKWLIFEDRTNQRYTFYYKAENDLYQIASFSIGFIPSGVGMSVIFNLYDIQEVMYTSTLIGER